MRRHIQISGVRKWSGDDLVQLQSESLRAIDGFFAQYGPCIVKGCEITPSGDKWDIAPGLVVLTGPARDPNAPVPEAEQAAAGDSASVSQQQETPEEITAIVPFEGATGVSLPLYLTLGCEVISRRYADGNLKPIAHDYYAAASAELPAEGVSYLALTPEEPAPRFVDAIQDPEHRFLTDAERADWNAKAVPQDITDAIDSLEIGGRNYFIQSPVYWEQGSWNAADGSDEEKLPQRIRLKEAISFSDPYLTIHNYRPEATLVWVCFYDAADQFLNSTWEMKQSEDAVETYTVPEGTASIRLTGQTLPDADIAPRDVADWKFMITSGNHPVQWAPAPEDVQAGVVIGGENLLPNSDFSVPDAVHYTNWSAHDLGPSIYTLAWENGELKVTGTEGADGTPNKRIMFVASETLPEEEYTLSMTVRSDVPTTLHARMFWDFGDDAVQIDTASRRVSFRIRKGPSLVDTIALWCDDPATLYISRPKLERGTHATDWSMSAADIQSKIASGGFNLLSNKTESWERGRLNITTGQLEFPQGIWDYHQCSITHTPYIPVCGGETLAFNMWDFDDSDSTLGLLLCYYEFEEDGTYIRKPDYVYVNKGESFQVGDTTRYIRVHIQFKQKGVNSYLTPDDFFGAGGKIALSRGQAMARWSYPLPDMVEGKLDKTGGTLTGELHTTQDILIEKTGNGQEYDGGYVRLGRDRNGAYIGNFNDERQTSQLRLWNDGRITYWNSTFHNTTGFKDIWHADNLRIWKGTRAQYDAIATKDPETLYFVTA